MVVLYKSTTIFNDLDNKANSNHTHSNYALSSHTHSNYVTSTQVSTIVNNAIESGDITMSGGGFKSSAIGSSKEINLSGNGLIIFKDPCSTDLNHYFTIKVDGNDLGSDFRWFINESTSYVFFTKSINIYINSRPTSSWQSKQIAIQYIVYYF